MRTLHGHCIQIKYTHVFNTMGKYCLVIEKEHNQIIKIKLAQ